MRHNLSPESASWGNEVNSALRSVESDLILARQDLQVLNDQVRQQTIEAGNVSNVLSEQSPSGVGWEVSGTVSSGGGFLGPSYAVTAPAWATSVAVTRVTLTDFSSAGVGFAQVLHSNTPISSPSGGAGSAQFSNTGRVIVWSTVVTLTDELRTLYSRVYAAPTGGSPSWTVSTTVSLGLIWLP